MKRLVDKKGADASGVCSFIYRGYEISSSNKPGYWDIVVFDNSGQVARDGLDPMRLKSARSLTVSA